MIADCYEGRLDDSRWSSRMRRGGKVAESIHQLVRISTKRFMQGGL